MTRGVVAAGLFFVVAVVLSSEAPAQEDAYLEGYATALLEQRFGLRGVDVEVQDGVWRLDPGVFPAERRDEIVSALGEIEGLSIEVLGPARTAPQPPPEPAREKIIVVSDAMGILPREALFDDLIADPRWPRFSASLQFYDDEEGIDTTVGAANFGATLPVYGWTALGGQWQVGVQAGVFSIFDMEAESLDLINADYLVGVPLQLRYGPFSTQLRVFHQSSHLGDEFLLRGEDVERINLSYEVVDALASIDLFEFLRLYGGAGYVFHSDPDLDPLRVQAGAEATTPDPLFGTIVYPVAAFDFQSTEEADWESDYSARAGLELRTEFLEERRLQFLLEYFNGRSPNGQFFQSDLEYFGAGVHFYF